MIHADFETYSELDVKQVGAFRYSAHPSTDILILAYAFEAEEVRVWSPYEDIDPPEELLEAVMFGEPLGAHNAQFEYCIWNRVAVRKYGWPRLSPNQLVCTAAQAAMASLPRALGRACAAMNLPERKDTEGSRLMRIFSMPQKRGQRVMPHERPEEFAEFKAYCAQDVRSERVLGNSLPHLPAREREIYVLDLVINERGMRIDIPLAKNAYKIVQQFEHEGNERVKALTGGVKATQVQKLLQHLNLEGAEVDNLQKETLKRFLKDEDITPDVREIIELRMEGARASTKKLLAMSRLAEEDWRVRGTILYHGAHTGRWTGKLIQPHNFIRGLLKELERNAVFTLLATADPEAFRLIFDKPIDAIAQCMRGFIVPAPGFRFIVVDYKQIELRILLWLANEIAGLRRIREGYDLYKWMGAKLFDRIYEPLLDYDNVEDEERRNGKNLILGCGFGLGAVKFVDYSDKAGITITEEFSKFAVRTYRDEHPAVVRYWRAVINAAIAAVKERGMTKIGPVVFDGRDTTFFTIRLPSGRKMYYPFPELRMAKARYKRNGKDVLEEQLTYMEEYNGRWVRNSTYGGKLVENIVQGMARDVMAEGMLKAEEHGYPIIMTVHDEIIAEVPEGVGSVDEFRRVACDLPAWIGDCPIEAEGFETYRYKKG